MANEQSNATKHISAILQEKLAPITLIVTDTSAGHKGHGGYREGETTHIRIKIGGGALRGLSRIAAHRAINAELADAFAAGLHAVEIRVLKHEDN